VDNPNRDLLRLVVQLVDIRIGPTEDDLMMIEFMESYNIPFLIAASKSDKLSKTAVAKAVDELGAAFPGHKVLAFSSLSGAGKEELRAAILAAAEVK
jgi:GTP-binding protein